jgi:predicted NUDIX family NTP pyrophosphohydrolase
MFHRFRGTVEVLLVHPGGPFWKNKDDGAWSIPKGLVEPGEDPLAAARREFVEETGFEVRDPLIPLESIRQKSGKIVMAWAFEGDCDPARLRSNMFELEFPPRSKKWIAVPEGDSAEWFAPAVALKKISGAQGALIEELLRKIGAE